MRGCSREVSPAAGLELSIAQQFLFTVGSTAGEVPPACAQQEGNDCESRPAKGEVLHQSACMLGLEGREK